MSFMSNSGARADVYTRITAEIIAAIEKGAGDWRAPWFHDGASAACPVNVASGRRYRGINTLALWAAEFHDLEPANRDGSLEQPIIGIAAYRSAGPQYTGRLPTFARHLSDRTGGQRDASHTAHWRPGPFQRSAPTFVGRACRAGRPPSRRPDSPCHTSYSEPQPGHVP